MPAVFGSLDDAFKLYETVKSSGKKYMMFETSAFHDDCYAMRQIYSAGGFGKLIYSEGEYFHYMPGADSLVQGLAGRPAAAMVSHAFATAYYCCVSGGSFTEVSCMGMPSLDQAVAAGRTTRTRTPSAPRSPCFGRAKAGWPAWPSVGTRRATKAKWAACAGNAVR